MIDTILPAWQLIDLPSAKSDGRIQVNSTPTEAANLTTTTLSPPAEHVWLQRTLSDIRMTFLPIIVAGTMTNCLNFVVLSHREMRTVPTLPEQRFVITHPLLLEQRKISTLVTGLLIDSGDSTGSRECAVGLPIGTSYRIQFDTVRPTVTLVRNRVVGSSKIRSNARCGPSARRCTCSRWQWPTSA